MTITNTSVFSPNPECPVREIGDGLVLMAPDGSTTHSLEDIGAFIWRQIDGERDLDAIIAALTTEYDVDRDTAEKDLKAFLGELIEAGLLHQVR